MHLNTMLMFSKHIAPRLTPGMSVLEIGPDTTPSSFEEKAPGVVWETAELAAAFGADGRRLYGPPDARPATYLMDDEYTIPVPDESFDVVLSTNVIEHVREIWRWMPEVARVAKRGGIVATICPLSWPYHESPVDCWRIYPDGLRALSEMSGLAVEVAEFEALEDTPSKRPFAGAGRDLGAPPNTSLRGRIQGLLGWPLPVAYDTVCVARKV